MQREGYRQAMEQAGLRVTRFDDNLEYQFVSECAEGAVRKWGVKSV